MKPFVTLLCLAAAIARADPVDVLLTASTDEEFAPLLSRIESPVVEKQSVWTFWTGTLAGNKVALARTEGDPLNAVAATTLGIRRFQPKLVLTFGTARALDPSLKRGDVVVSSSFAAFDGAFTPVVPEGGGIHPLNWFRLRHAAMTAGEKETPMDGFPSDAATAARIKAVADGDVVAATLGSANQLNREADRIAWIHKEWGASTEDGESAHIAGCAFLLGVPVAGVRVVDGAPGEAAAIILKLLEAR